MSCASLSLAALDSRCDTSTGGVKEVYIGAFGDLTPGTPSAGLISALTLAGSKLVIFRFRKGAATMEATANIDADNGSAYVTTTIAMNFTKMESAKRVQIQALIAGGAMCIVLDNNGKYWLLGYDAPLDCSAASGSTGTAWSDANQYTITLTDTSRELPFEVAGTAITSSVIDGL